MIIVKDEKAREAIKLLLDMLHLQFDLITSNQGDLTSQDEEIQTNTTNVIMELLDDD